MKKINKSLSQHFSVWEDHHSDHSKLHDFPMFKRSDSDVKGGKGSFPVVFFLWGGGGHLVIQPTK